jgi:hypothetical protein
MPRYSPSSVIIIMTSGLSYYSEKREAFRFHSKADLQRDQVGVRVLSLPPVLLLEQLS